MRWALRTWYLWVRWFSRHFLGHGTYELTGWSLTNPILHILKVASKEPLQSLELQKDMEPNFSMPLSRSLCKRIPRTYFASRPPALNENKLLDILETDTFLQFPWGSYQSISICFSIHAINAYRSKCYPSDSNSVNKCTWSHRKHQGYYGSASQNRRCSL